MMREDCGELRHSVNGEEVRVQDVSHLRCPQCGEVILLYDQARCLRER